MNSIFLVCLACILLPGVHGACCPQGFDVVMGRCLKGFYPPRLNWTEAQKLCKEKGGYLANVLSPEDQMAVAHVRNNLENKKRWAWIGAVSCRGDPYFFNPTPSDSYDINSCDVPVACRDYYSNWVSGQPADDTNHCVHFLVSNKWNVRSCSDEIPFICQADPREA